MKKHYYAFEYPCGLAISANSGKRYGQFYRFSSKKERELFIENGGDGPGSPNYREAIPANDSELRAAQKKEGWGKSTIEHSQQTGTIETLEKPI